MVKRIAIVTGTRADYGLLTPLISLIDADPDLECLVIVTGAHLAPEFGLTVREIRADGVAIADEVEMLLSSDSAHGTAKSVGMGTIGFADSFRRLQPDLVVVLGDRFEILAAATAAMLIGIPVAHIHGGERTEGAVDESIRHAVTKMSRLHFVSTDEYARRVVQLGERPDDVLQVGAIGLDRIDRSGLVSKEELAASLGLPADIPWCAVTFHPVTLEPGRNVEHFRAVLDAVRARSDIHFVFTKANADAEGRAINEMIAGFVDEVPHASLFDSLGSRIYLGVMAASAFVMGNSSSGIIEAPFLGIPTIDIGNRQKGRVRPSSVVHVEPDTAAIAAAIERCVSHPEAGTPADNPYYSGGAAPRIVAAIKAWRPTSMKSFHDFERT